VIGFAKFVVMLAVALAAAGAIALATALVGGTLYVVYLLFEGLFAW
jgi:hypothetical protein